jgi:hypothetical protein
MAFPGEAEHMRMDGKLDSGRLGFGEQRDGPSAVLSDRRGGT